MLNRFSELQNAASLRRFLLLGGILLLLAGCEREVPAALNLCVAEYTPINIIQGPGERSAMSGQTAITAGIATRIEQQGFFLQSAIVDMDADPNTSEALWVESLDQPAAGTVIGVTGEVAELASESRQQTVTALVEADWQQCGDPVELPHQVAQQLDNPEAVEHMRLEIPAGWQAADLYPLGDQRVRIASERLFIPTQVVSPGTPAGQLATRNSQRSVYIDWSASGATLHSRLRAGDQIEPVTGVFDLRARRPALLAEAAPAVSQAARVPAAPVRDAERQLRVVGINVENLFNGDGQGGDFPTPRGAETEQEYQQQQARLIAAIDALAPDILALMELENDGYDEHSTIAQLAAALDQLEGQRWAYVDPGQAQLGGDVIAVGLLYRNDRVSATGDAATITSRPFDDLSRAPLAQRFTAAASDVSLLVAVNHFKSKGSCPDGNGRNSDQRDGQGCWNEARERSAQVLSEWVGQLQQQWNEPSALIIGDLNSYRMEDPIRALIREGWTDVAGQFLDPPLYSYRYFGEIGTLDYAFANPALMERVENADIWHINADTAPGQSIPANSTGIARFSDHDPVIVDIRLSD